MLTSIKLVVMSLLLVYAAPLSAEENEGKEDEEEAMRARVVTEEETGARFQRPEGWVESTPGDGASVALRAAGDRRAQIEVRVSPDIEREKSAYFFSSFNSKLREQGFDREEERKEAVHGDHHGREVEYTARTRGDSFRLIVWQFYHDEAAIMVVGFFPEQVRDDYYEDFGRLIESMELDAGA